MIEFTPVEYINVSATPWETIMLATDVDGYNAAKAEFFAAGKRGECAYIAAQFHAQVAQFLKVHPRGQFLGMRWKHQEDLMMFKLRYAD